MLHQSWISCEDPMPAPESIELEDSKKLGDHDAALEDSRGGRKRPSALEKHRQDASNDHAGLEDFGRARLKRHRLEIANRVCIPETWGQEAMLKDWADCSAFTSFLVPRGVASARQALVDECRRSTSCRLKAEIRC